MNTPPHPTPPLFLLFIDFLSLFFKMVFRRVGKFFAKVPWCVSLCVFFSFFPGYVQSKANQKENIYLSTLPFLF